MFGNVKKLTKDAMQSAKKIAVDAKDTTISKALETIADKVINPRITEYGKITDIEIENKKVSCTVQLLGLENEPFTVTCGHIFISDDNSTIQLGQFESNMPFLKNALDKYATKEFKIPDNAIARKCLAVAKKLL